NKITQQQYDNAQKYLKDLIHKQVEHGEQVIFTKNDFNNIYPNLKTNPNLEFDITLFSINEFNQHNYYHTVHYYYKYNEFSWVPVVTSKKRFSDRNFVPNWAFEMLPELRNNL
ncbi:MAG: hypothetical protein Q8N56_03190, partial [bacterium]|nr:hypothetical protein [bacterium]